MFELDTRTSELRKQGVRIRLQKKPLLILQLLLERSGDVVTREELRKALWSPDVFVDFDHSLNSAVNKVREALADSASNPRFIETLSGGYRFIAPVTPVRTPQAAEDPEKHPSDEPSRQPPAIFPRVPRVWQIVAAGIVVASVLVAGAMAGLHTFGARSSPKTLALAVLPFRNLSADPEQEFFSDGFTEEMIAQLGKLEPTHLRVIARSSAMPYKRTSKSIDQIGAELGVDYVLEGSIRHAGSRVRITAELIRVRDQAQVWARSYERDLQDVLSLQVEVAQAIADEVEVAFRPPKASPPHRARVSPEVHEAYLKGRYFLDKSPEALDKSIASFQEAVRLDPSFAPAYAGLADAYASQGYGFASDVAPAEAYAKARAAATKALELDPELAEAHVSLARILWKYDWNWRAAEDAFKRAIELDPSSATAHESYFDCLSAMKRNQEAYVELTRAAALDPVSLTINYDFGLHFARTGEYDKAIARLKKAIDLDPTSGFVHHVLGELYAELGQYRLATAELEQAIQLSGKVPHFVAALGVVRGMTGQRAAAVEALEYLQSLTPKKYVSGHDLAMLHASLGNRQLALASLMQASRDHDIWLSLSLVQFGLDPIRSEPGFQELLSRVGLTAYSPAPGR